MNSPVDSTRGLIAKRRADIEAQRAKVKQMLAELDAQEVALRAEEADLDVTERTLARLANQNHQVDLVNGPNGDRYTSLELKTETVHVAANSMKSAAKGTPRPAGIPTVPDMVTALLVEGENAGLAGLDARTIMDAIDKRWWPGVSPNMVMPTVYRCVQRGHWFTKEGKLFKRLKDGVPKRTPSIGADIGLLKQIKVFG